MSEIEVPLESSQEKIMESAREAAHRDEERWFNWVALSSAVFAVVAAISALLAGHHSNEALLEQIQASDHWSYFQAKGIKSSVLASKMQLLSQLGKKEDPKDNEKLETYKKEQEEIAEQAKEKEMASRHHLEVHKTFAQAVTFIQVAMAVSAIALLMRRRRFWLVSLGVGALGLVYFAVGLAHHW